MDSRQPSPQRSHVRALPNTLAPLDPDMFSDSPRLTALIDTHWPRGHFDVGAEHPEVLDPDCVGSS